MKYRCTVIKEWHWNIEADSQQEADYLANDNSEHITRTHPYATTVTAEPTQQSTGSDERLV